MQAAARFWHDAGTTLLYCLSLRCTAESRASPADREVAKGSEGASEGTDPEGAGPAEGSPRVPDPGNVPLPAAGFSDGASDPISLATVSAGSGAENPISLARVSAGSGAPNPISVGTSPVQQYSAEDLPPPKRRKTLEHGPHPQSGAEGKPERVETLARDSSADPNARAETLTLVQGEVETLKKADEQRRRTLTAEDVAGRLTDLPVWDRDCAVLRSGTGVPLEADVPPAAPQGFRGAVTAAWHALNLGLVPREVLRIALLEDSGAGWGPKFPAREEGKPGGARPIGAGDNGGADQCCEGAVEPLHQCRDPARCTRRAAGNTVGTFAGPVRKELEALRRKAAPREPEDPACGTLRELGSGSPPAGADLCTDAGSVGADGKDFRTAREDWEDGTEGVWHIGAGGNGREQAGGETGNAGGSGAAEDGAGARESVGPRVLVVADGDLNGWMALAMGGIARLARAARLFEVRRPLLLPQCRWVNSAPAGEKADAA
jgi:hypothetical protein